MLTRSLPVFLFNEESIFSHANNIHTIFSSLPFEEIRLSQSQCKELLATALGFANLKQLKEKLMLGTFTDIELPIDAEQIISKRILELTSPLPFSTIEIPNDDEKYIYPVNQYGCTKKHLEPQCKIFKNDLLRVKHDWKDWHIVLGKYINSYLKETIGHFDYFSKLKLSSHLVTFPEQLFHFTNSEETQCNRFLHSVIYNHLIVYCPTEPKYSEQLQAIPMKKRMYEFDVYLSPELKTYLDKNESKLSDLQACKVQQELPLVLSYNQRTETAKMNILPNLDNFHRMNKAKRLSTRYKEQHKTPQDIMNYLSNVKLDKLDIMSKCNFEISVMNKHVHLPNIDGVEWPEFIHFTQNDLLDFKIIGSSILRDLSFGPYLMYLPESGANHLSSFNEKQLKIPEFLSFGFHFTKRLDVVYTSNENSLEVPHGVAANLYMRYEIKADLALELMENNRLEIYFDNIKGGIKRNKDLYSNENPNLALSLETFKLSNPEIKELTDKRNLKISNLKIKGLKEAMNNGFPLGVYKQHLQKHHMFALVKVHQNVFNTYKLIKNNVHSKRTEPMMELMELYEPLEHLEPQV